MDIPGLKSNMPMYPDSDIEKLRGKASDNLEAEKVRLRKATKEFESMVMYEMLKTMRKTIPENTMSEGSPFAGGLGKDIFTQMFDQQLAKEVTSDSRSGIAELLYNQTVKILEAEHAAPINEIKGLTDPKAVPIKLDDKIFMERLPSQMNFKPKEKFQPISSKSPVQKPKDIDPSLWKYAFHIRSAAKEHGLDSSLISSVIQAESNGNPKAISPAGAKGLMQLMDSTAEQYGVTDPFNPRDNINGGAKYLKKMMDKYGDLKLALAAYNAGPGNVDRYGGVPPFPETIKYVEKVVEGVAKLKGNKQ